MSGNGSVPVVDTGLCIGAARCVEYAPATFTQNDEGVVELLSDGTGHEDEQHISKAVPACPVRAIRLHWQVPLVLFHG
jgi:ferredoxin